MARPKSAYVIGLRPGERIASPVWRSAAASAKPPSERTSVPAGRAARSAMTPSTLPRAVQGERHDDVVDVLPVQEEELAQDRLDLEAAPGIEVPRGRVVAEHAQHQRA